jgi:hypothetical protein
MNASALTRNVGIGGKKDAKATMLITARIPAGRTVARSSNFTPRIARACFCG